MYHKRNKVPAQNTNNGTLWVHFIPNSALNNANHGGNQRTSRHPTCCAPPPCGATRQASHFLLQPILIRRQVALRETAERHFDPATGPRQEVLHGRDRHISRLLLRIPVDPGADRGERDRPDPVLHRDFKRSEALTMASTSSVAFPSPDNRQTAIGDRQSTMPRASP